MRIRVLGEIEIVTDGAAARIGSPSQRVVLAVLASQPGIAASSDLLIDALWGADPPPTARASLRTYVSRLRRHLGDNVMIGPSGYTLAVPDDEIDASRFENLVEKASTLTTTDPFTALSALDEALEHWRGTPFGDASDAEPLAPAVARLEACHAAACESRAAALLAAGRAADAVAAAEELVTRDPLWEGAWAVLIEALVAATRAPEALRAFQRAVHALAKAGLEPSERLRRAEATALSQRQPEVRPRKLAVAMSSLVGRDADVEAVLDLLAAHRVVTLVGPGGVGKTRLALEVAARAADRFEWGARMVKLAAVADPRSVLGVIVEELGLSAQSGAVDAVLAAAGQLDMLGVLDNCEHVIDAASEAAEIMTAGGTSMRLLATSREPLAVDGEHLWPVSPLATGVSAPVVGPSTRTERSTQRSWSPAHELFTQRARAVRPDFDPEPREDEAINTITQRLDGLPLAIEMAATRVATMPVTELADRLSKELGVVASRRRNIEPRHRTLAAVVTWSEQLLRDAERALFADMSVFEGAIRAEDVAAVTGRRDPLDLLAHLAERSLLVAETSGQRSRFSMLRTIRDRARELATDAGRAPDLAARHAEHVTAVLVEADRELRTPHEKEADTRIRELLPDARAAYVWAIEHDAALAARLSGALLLFGQSRRRDEVLGWSSALVPRLDPSIDAHSRASVLSAAAQQTVDRGNVTLALDLAERAAQVAAGDQHASSAEAMAYEIVSDIHLFAGRLAESIRAAEAGREAAERSGDPHTMCSNLLNIVMASAYGGDFDRADRVLSGVPDDAVLAPSDRAWVRYGRGEVILDRDPTRALALLDEAIALADSVGNAYVGGVARVSATSLRARAGDPEAALGPFAETINHWRAQSNSPFQATTLRNLVVLLQRLGAAPEVVELLGSTQSGSVSPTYGDEARRLADARGWAESQLGADEVERCFTAGAGRSLEEAAVLALEWIAAH